MTSTQTDYTKHSDPAVAALGKKLADAEATLDAAKEELERARREERTAGRNHTDAEQRVGRLRDAISVLAGEPGVHVSRSRR